MWLEPLLADSASQIDARTDLGAIVIGNQVDAERRCGDGKGEGRNEVEVLPEISTTIATKSGLAVPGCWGCVSISRFS